MSTYTVRLQTLFRLLWNSSAPLTAVCLLMLADTVIAALGLAFDSRQVAGVPVWMKPFKFGISTALYTGTLAWFCGFVKAPRAAWVAAVGLVVEIALINVQAGRGVISHFNNSSTLDGIVFGLMGAVIGVVWVASVVIAVALFRQKFADAAWGWSLRLGLAISLLGAAAGGMMLGPTKDQNTALREGRVTPVIGGHTVGAPDGGPGIPGLGWSTEHGDLRVPHFFGLHAAQVIPLLAWWLRRRRVRVSTIVGIAAGYMGLIVILGWQAFRGQPVIHPDGLTLAVLALWISACMMVLTGAARTREITA